MNVKIRRIIYYFVVGIFVIAAPLLILYASGYRYDVKRQQINKVGALAISFEQKDVELLIDGEIKTDRPYRETMNPGEHKIVVSKPGYHPYQETILIKKDKSAVQHITLYQDRLPELVMAGEISNLKTNREQSRIAFAATNKDSTVVVLENNELTEIHNFTSSKDRPDLTLQWNDDSTHLLFSLNQLRPFLSILSSTGKSEERSLRSIFGSRVEQARWIENSKLLAASEGELLELDIVSKEAKSIASYFTIHDFYRQGSTTAVIAESAPNTLVLVISKDGSTRTFPLSQAEYKFVDGDHPLTMLDLTHDLAYIINNKPTSIQPFQDVISGVTSLRWADNKLLLSNEFEIWIYYPQDFKKELLTRISQEIDGIAWAPNDQDVIYMTDETIFLFNVNSPNQQTTALAKYDQAENLLVNTHNKQLFFVGNIGKQQGLFQLPLY